MARLPANLTSSAPRKRPTPFGSLPIEDRPFLRQNEIHVGCAYVPEWECRLDDLQSVLSPDERDRAQRFRFRSDRSRFVVGHGLMRGLAGQHLQRPAVTIRFEYGPNGKPHVVDPPFPFSVNLSHSGDWVLVALGRLPHLGVDVEQHSETVVPLELAESVFSAWERQTLQEMPPSLQFRLFFDLWARKEAVIKADGRGVGFGLQRFDVEFRPNHAPRVRRIDGEHARDWTLQSLTIAPNYAASVACRAHPRRTYRTRLAPHAPNLSAFE